MRVGDNQMAKSLSTQFFIAAALLALFGLAENAPSSGMPASSSSNLGMIQLVLAVAMAGAGVFLRGGTPAARAVGLCVAGGTALFGAYALLSGMGYVPGTIVAIYGLFHLLNAEGAFADGTQPAQTACDPLPYSPAAPPATAPGFAPTATGRARHSRPHRPPTTGSATSVRFPAHALPPANPAPPAPPVPPSARPDPRFGD